MRIDVEVEGRLYAVTIGRGGKASTLRAIVRRPGGEFGRILWQRDEGPPSECRPLLRKVITLAEAAFHTTIAPGQTEPRAGVQHVPHPDPAIEARARALYLTRCRALGIKDAKWEQVGSPEPWWRAAGGR